MNFFSIMFASELLEFFATIGQPFFPKVFFQRDFSKENF